MENSRIYSMIGLAMRAGAVVLGEGKVSASIKNGTAKAVVLSADASENTKKKIRNSCSFYNVELVEIGDRFMLGKCTGRGFAVSAAIINREMAARIIELSREQEL